MTIYEELIQRVSDGEKFYIDFEKRIMKIGKQKIIDGGNYDEERMLIKLEHNSIESILREIESLYQKYKYSLPSERSDNKRKCYFKALSVDKLTDAEMATGERREVAQAKLEGFILCMVLKGVLAWSDDIGKWFWQSANDPDLVILKSWIENKNN